MPLYEYQCDACRNRFERIQKFSDPPLETCPSCGGAVTKLLSSPAIQFKGTGWYITDYAKKGNSDGTNKAAGEAGGSTGESASSSGDSTTKSSDSSGDSAARAAGTSSR